LTVNTEKLRVVIACDTFSPDINGAARFAERLAAGLVRRGHEIHIIAPAASSAHGSFSEVIDGAEMVVHRMPSLRIPQHKSLRFVHPFGLSRRIRRIIAEINPVALHMNSHLMIGRFALSAIRTMNLNVVATNHVMPENLMRYSFVPKLLQGLMMRLLWADAGRVLRRVGTVTSPTRRAADLLEREAGLSGVLAISCGINAARFANTTPTSTQPKRVLYLGRLDAEKRVDVLLRAVAELTQHPDIEVELVGDGGERSALGKLAVELGIADRVLFTGHIAEIDLPAAYERATVFVMPSIAELQSIATMEAMASGRPVIGANAMALPHLVHDGDNGYLFEPDNHLDLADRLARIFEATPDELERLSENSLHLISSHDINQTLDIFENLYRGAGEQSLTTADNLPAYLEPIGRLSESVRSQLSSWRRDSLAIRSRADELRELARERLDELRSDARERYEEVREVAIERISEVRDTARERLSEARDTARKRLRKKRPK
jgi:glycosyltransferase involved in cell wall biosynthesis